MITLAVIVAALKDITLVGSLLYLAWLARHGYIHQGISWLARKARGEFAPPKPPALIYGPARKLTPGLPADGERLTDEETDVLIGMEQAEDWPSFPVRRGES